MSSLAGVLIGAALNGTDGAPSSDDLILFYCCYYVIVHANVVNGSLLVSCFSGSLYTGMLNAPFTPLSPAPLDTVVCTASHDLRAVMMMLMMMMTMVLIVVVMMKMLLLVVMAMMTTMLCSTTIMDRRFPLWPCFLVLPLHSLAPPPACYRYVTCAIFLIFFRQPKPYRTLGAHARANARGSFVTNAIFTSARQPAATIAPLTSSARGACAAAAIPSASDVCPSLSSCLRMLLSALHFAAFWCVERCAAVRFRTLIPTLLPLHLCHRHLVVVAASSSAVAYSFVTALAVTPLPATQALPCDPAHVRRVVLLHHRRQRLVHLRTFMPLVHDCRPKKRHHAGCGVVHDSGSFVRFNDHVQFNAICNALCMCGYGPSLNQAVKWNVNWFFSVRMRTHAAQCCAR